MRIIRPVAIAGFVLALGTGAPAAVPAAAGQSATVSAASQASAASGAVASSATALGASSQSSSPVVTPAPSAGPAASAGSGEPAQAGKGRRWIPIVEADVRGAVGKMSSDKWNGGVVGNVFVLPAYRLAERTTLLPIYAFTGAMLNQAVEVEDVVFFQMQQTHSLSLGVKQAFGDRVDGRISLDGGWALTQETRGESIGHGLYDYRDFGGRASATWDPALMDRRSPVTVGARLYERWYPNFGSLAVEDAQNLIVESPALLASLAGREQHPKDFHALEPGISAYMWPTAAVQARIGWSTAFRAYTDRYLRSDQGALEGKRRADQLHRLVAGGAARVSRSWSTGLDVTWLLNVSNQSVYNADQPVHAFIPRFYQFSSISLEPWVMWVVPVGSALKPRVRVGGFLLTRDFTDRLAQFQDGIYTNSRQHDAFYGADLTGWYPLNRWLSVAAGMNARVARSNNLSEQFIRYHYEGVAFSLGVAISY